MICVPCVFFDAVKIILISTPGLIAFIFLIVDKIKRKKRGKNERI